MSSTYVYSPLSHDLKEIRLLYLDTITPSRNGSAVRLSGRLVHISLANFAAYNALSYVWGDPTATSAIFLDDGTHIAITSNLHDALLNIFVDGFVPIPIWIDAVSINQSDDQEKSWQVQMMDQIYSNASKTFIYLGPATNISNEALDTFTAYGNEALQQGIFDVVQDMDTDVTMFCYEQWEKASLRSRGDALFDNIFHKLRDLDQTAPDDLLDSFMQSPWWTRMWVLQEMLLSPHPVFVRGNKSIPTRVFFASFKLYETALHRFTTTRDSESYGSALKDYQGDLLRLFMIRPLFKFRSFANYPAIKFYTIQLRQKARLAHDETTKSLISYGNLWSLVQGTGCSAIRMHTADPRDRIFALAGLARLDTTNPLTIKPNYSLTCADLYVLVTVLFIKHVGPRLLELAYGSWRRDWGPNFPSWAIDWSMVEIPSSFLAANKGGSRKDFGYTRLPTGTQVLIAPARLFGRLRILQVDAPIFEEKLPPELDKENAIRLCKYLSTLNTYVQRLQTKKNIAPDYLDGLVRAMLIKAGRTSPSLSAIESHSTIAVTVVSLLREAISVMRNERQSAAPVDTGSASAGLSTGMPEELARFGFDIITLLNAPAMSESPMSLLLQEWERNSTTIKDLRAAFHDLRLVAQPYTGIFVIGQDLVGVATQQTHDNDILVEFEGLGTNFIVRPVDRGLHKLITPAYISRLDSQKASDVNFHAARIGLC